MFSVSRNVTACVQEIRNDANAQAAAAGKRVAILRTGLWIATILITVILVITFMILYKQMINPLTGFVRLIASNQFLDEKEGMLICDIDKKMLSNARSTWKFRDIQSKINSN